MREVTVSIARILAMATAVALASGASASAIDRGLRVFAGAAWVAPLDDSAARLDGEAATLEVGSSAGLEAGFEWRFAPRFGVEAGVVRTTLDVDFGSTRLGDVDFEPILVALNIHLVRDGRVDLWMAPTLFLVDWGEPDLARGVELGDDSDEALGAGFGLDLALSEHWALTVAARYVDLQIRFAGGGEAAVDPLLFRAGLSWSPGRGASTRHRP